MTYDVFISYAHQDVELATQMRTELEAAGITCWMATPEIIPPGADFPGQIVDAINAARLVVLIFTATANQSRWVANEIDRAFEKERRILPFRVTDEPPSKALELFLSRLQWFDGRPTEDSIARFVGRVRDVLAGKEPQPPTLAERVGAWFRRWGKLLAAGTIVVMAIVIYLWQQLLPPQPGEVRTNKTDGLHYVWVPPGEFDMGCTDSNEDDCFPENNLARLVRLTQGFWMGTTEVTVGAYRHFAHDHMPEAPAENPDWTHDHYPMQNVSWDEAAAYCRWTGGALPSEAQWEYAARGGRKGLRFPSGNELRQEDGRFASDAPTAVGSFHANDFGLHDMVGNVSEWTRNWWSEGLQGELPVDPEGPASGDGRTIKGGSYPEPAGRQRVYLRFHAHPDERGEIGFRCVLPSRAPQLY